MANDPSPRHRNPDDRRDESNPRADEQAARESPSYTPQGRTDEGTRPVDAPGDTPQGRTDEEQP